MSRIAGGSSQAVLVVAVVAVLEGLGRCDHTGTPGR